MPALAALPLAAATFQVDSVADAPDLDAGDGLCRTAAGDCSLRAAIQQANATPGYDTVLLPEGGYPLNLGGAAGEDAAARGDLDIREPLALLGIAPAGSSIGVQIFGATFGAGAGGDRLFDIDTASPLVPVRIERVMISFGASAETSGGGGLLLRAGSALTLRDVMFYANVSGSVGSALAVYGEAQLRDVRLSDNHVGFPVTASNMRGTLYVGGEGRLDADHVVFDTNTAEAGGALALADNATASLRRCSLAENSADSRGGSGADAGLGGGILLEGSARLTLENCTMAGLFGLTADPAGYNSVVVRDAAQLELQHVSVQALPLRTLGSGAARIRLRDSLLLSQGQAAQGCSGQLVSAGGNWLGSTTACALATGADDRVGEPLLPRQQLTLNVAVAGAAGANRQGLPHTVLVPPATAADGAAPAGCPGADQLGAARPAPSASGQPRGCDAGAIELPLDHVFVDGWDDTP